MTNSLQVPAPEAAAPVQIEWRKVFLLALGAWLATRLAYVVLTGFAVALNSRHAGAVHDPIWIWVQWDTGWYYSISRIGYWIRPSANFFPLFPALGGALAWLAGHGQYGPAPDDLRVAGLLLVANLGSLAGLTGIALLAVRELGSIDDAWRSLRLALAYPYALFLVAGYTEGPALGLMAMALYWARSARWRWAFLAALLAGLTRSTSVVLALPLAWEYGRQHGWWAGSGRARERQGLTFGSAAAGVAVVLAVPLGIAVFGLYLWRAFGDPLLFAHTQLTYWGHSLEWPWRTLALVASRLIHHNGGLLPLDAAALVGFGGVTIALIRRMPFAFTLYMAGLLYFTFASPTLAESDLIASTGRYLTLSIPLFVYAGRWLEGRPSLDLLLTSAGFMLQAGLALTFLAGGPVR